VEVGQLPPDGIDGAGGGGAGGGVAVARAAATFRRVSALFAAIGFAESALVPFAPLLLLQRGFSDSEIGVAFAVMALLGFVAGPAWAYAADRAIGSERALTICCLLASLASLGVLAASGVAATFLSMSVLWVVRSPGTALIDAIALDLLQADRRTDYGRIRLWQSAGWAAGAIVWGGVLQVVGLRYMNVAYPVLIAGVAVYALTALGRRRRAQRPHSRLDLSGAAGVLPVLALFLLALLLVNSAFSGTLTFATIRIEELGGGAFLVGVAGCLQAAVEVPVMGATPRLSRRVRPGSVFALGSVVYVAVFLTWALVPDALAVALVRAVAGVGFGLIYVASVVIVDELVPARLRATGQAGSKGVAWGVAPVLGSLGGGFVYALSPPALFVVAAGMAAAAAAAAAAAEGRSPARG
jgi:PPP family 3-phenylpropionic acid transporter